MPIGCTGRTVRRKLFSGQTCRVEPAAAASTLPAQNRGRWRRAHDSAAADVDSAETTPRPRTIIGQPPWKEVDGNSGNWEFHRGEELAGSTCTLNGMSNDGEGGGHKNLFFWVEQDLPIGNKAANQPFAASAKIPRRCTRSNKEEADGKAGEQPGQSGSGLF